MSGGFIQWTGKPWGADFIQHQANSAPRVFPKHRWAVCLSTQAGLGLEYTWPAVFSLPGMTGSSGFPVNPGALLKPGWKDKPALLIGEKGGIMRFVFLVLPYRKIERFGCCVAWPWKSDNPINGFRKHQVGFKICPANRRSCSLEWQKTQSPF